MTGFRAIASIEATDPPTLRVSWADLPALWWRDVPVVQLEPVELNELDIFVVEAATRLGRLPAATFTELTGLPALVFTTLGRRLQALELLEWQQDALVPTGNSAPALTEATAERRTTTTLDLLYLPETDDLLVVGEGLGDFERANPKIAGLAPVPTELHGLTLREFLGARIEERRVGNLSPAVVELAAMDGGDEPVTAMAGAKPDPKVPVAPAIEVAATIVLDGERSRAELEVAPRSDRRRTGQSAPAPAQPVMLDISGATGCIDSWRRIAERVGRRENRAAAIEALAPIPLGGALLQPDGPGRWSVAVTEAQAADLARGRPLTRSLGLEIREDHAHLRTAVRFAPADAAAERLFARDTLIQQVLGSPKDVVGVLERQANLLDAAGGHDVVRDRAWELGHHWVVHALRERQDFAYA
jgi:hypothetical protein